MEWLIIVFGFLWLVGLLLMDLDYGAKFWSMHRPPPPPPPPEDPPDAG